MSSGAAATPATAAKLEITHRFAAPVAQVWKAWTDANEVRRWFGRPASLMGSCVIDLKPGGMYCYTFRAADGRQSKAMGVFREVVENRRLVHTWETQGESSESCDGPRVRDTLVTVEFREVEGGGTEVRLRHEMLTDPGAREEHSTGWRMCVESLEQFCRVNTLKGEIERAKARLALERKGMGATPVFDYPLLDRDGKQVRLSELFGGKDELLVIHNMGRSCVYCTLWADGFNGVHRHLDDRCAFVLVSPDEPAVQREFAAGRGWTFRMLSSHGSPFTADMGFQDDDGDPWPGVTAFRKDPDGTIRRISSASFGPGDDFCAVWHLLGLLDRGENDWSPRYTYSS